MIWSCSMLALRHRRCGWLLLPPRYTAVRGIVVPRLTPKLKLKAKQKAKAAQHLSPPFGRRRVGPLGTVSAPPMVHSRFFVTVKRMDEPRERNNALHECIKVTNLARQKFSTEDSCELGCNIDMRKQVFCNRSLNMKSIIAVGFDMDYTLAQYKPETFETLAYNSTIKKLVCDLGYPKELLNWKFDWSYMIRGLVLDKKRGNILKMDRHKYVKIAYHGFTEMSRKDRISTYGNTLSRDSFDEPDYALIDTLFSVGEAYLFAQLVELKDAQPQKLPPDIDYSKIYKDVRAAVDLCHRDGTLKQFVARDPSKFIHYDPMIVPMLKLLRSSGRMTFLVTNSFWDYTHVVMNYLLKNDAADSSAPRDDLWLEYFDVVITGSSKPGFFNDEDKALIFEVDIGTGMLQNTDNGSRVPQVRGSLLEIVYISWCQQAFFLRKLFPH